MRRSARRPRLLASVVSLVVCVAGASPAVVATGRDGGEDPRLWRALAAYDAGRYGAALALWTEALERDPAAHELRYNIGRCHEAMGHPRAAIEAYEAYLAAVPDDADRPAIEARVRALERALAHEAVRVTVSSAPPGAALFVDGAAAPAGVTPLRVWLPVGERALRVERAGYLPTKRRVAVSSDGPRAVSFDLVAEDAPGRIRLRDVPPGVAVSLDGVPVAPSPDGLLGAAPGLREVRLVRGGRSVAARIVPVPPGGRVDLSFGAAALPAEVVVTRGSDGTRDGGGFEVPWYGWTAAGLTVAALGTALTFHLLALDEAERARSLAAGPAPDRARWFARKSDAERDVLIANVSLGVAGAAAIGTGLALWLHNTGDDADATLEVPALAPVPGGAALVLDGRF